MRYHKITQKNNNNKNNSKILSVTLLFSKLLPPNPLIATEVITDGPLFSKSLAVSVLQLCLQLDVLLVFLVELAY